MQTTKKSAILFATAALGPLLLLVSFEIAATLERMQRQAETTALSRASSFAARVDMELMGDIGALSVLAGSPYLRTESWMEARARAVGIAAERSHWKNVILTDIKKGNEIWGTAANGGGRQLARASALIFAKTPMVSQVSGFDADSSKCGCITLRQKVLVGSSTYVLTVERDVADFQNLLTAAVTEGEVAALVDRRGLFIARTIDYDNRRGSPATQFVRDAAARGGSGVYAGTTFEGLKNQTAYFSSQLSGWSTHIAVPAGHVELLSAGSFGFSLMAMVLAVSLAGAITWYGFKDLAEKRRGERARFQAQKLEAIGHFAGTVAHDFNNLLAIMVSCIRILSRSDSSTKRADIANQGIIAADRGGKLINQLLTFARDKPLELECVDMVGTLAGIKDLLIRSLGPGIEYDSNIAPAARYGRTNANQLELVLMNFAINARDAMPDGGKFSISARVRPDKSHIELLVRDTGAGMSEEVATRAFEPYFTTKPEGKGTGLGLAQAHLLATSSGGGLSLETSPGKGTLFILRLPLCNPVELHQERK